jgi:hypothetical protein
MKMYSNEVSGERAGLISLFWFSAEIQDSFGAHIIAKYILFIATRVYDLTSQIV